MAEIISNSKKTKGQRMVKKSTRVDLTPMVDLGFLLITFFVFTTTMAEPQVMNIISPKDDGTKNDPVCESCAITVVAAKNNQVFYYEGNPSDKPFLTTTYAASGLRDILQKKRQAVLKARGADECSLIIKPTNEASFGNLIDIIDESKICGIKRYYIDNPDARDLAAVVN
ncbi:MAG: Biopolymer transport protein ExbD/TolR [Ferruginibacter sp.]|nr:Biopolymer transport protein ExbD/TolR [Ferruginibacter sp.]